MLETNAFRPVFPLFYFLYYLWLVFSKLDLKNCL
jgi:hypothetical protein